MNTEIITSIILTIFTSTGFWTFLTYKLQKKDEKNSAENQMLKGLGHSKIYDLGSKYLERGYITCEEYKDLYNYLYVPYKKLGGNGTAAKIMQEIDKLPFKEQGESSNE